MDERQQEALGEVGLDRRLVAFDVHQDVVDRLDEQGAEAFGHFRLGDGLVQVELAIERRW